MPKPKLIIVTLMCHPIRFDFTRSEVPGMWKAMVTDISTPGQARQFPGPSLTTNQAAATMALALGFNLSDHGVTEQTENALREAVGRVWDDVPEHLRPI